jgi:hypothetical protein
MTILLARAPGSLCQLVGRSRSLRLLNQAPAECVRKTWVLQVESDQVLEIFVEPTCQAYREQK